MVTFELITGLNILPQDKFWKSAINEADSVAYLKSFAFLRLLIF